MRGNVRLMVSLACIAILAGVLLYTALAGGAVRHPIVEVDDLVKHEKVARAEPVELVGVAQGPVKRRDDGMTFTMVGRDGGGSVVIDYVGSVPDVFRPGREVVVTGKLDGDTFRAERNSLSTKCPSRFEAQENAPDSR